MLYETLYPVSSLYIINKLYKNIEIGSFEKYFKKFESLHKSEIDEHVSEYNNKLKEFIIKYFQK